MIKSKFNKIVKNNLYFIFLSLLILLTIFIANIYLSNKKSQIEDINNLLDNIYLKKTIDLVFNSLDPKYSYLNIKIDKGETFEKITNKLNLPINEKKFIINKLSKFKSINNLYQGQRIYIKLDNSNPARVIELKIEQSKTKYLVFSRIDNLNKFEFKEINKSLEKKKVYKESIIKKSLYQSAMEVGIEPNVIVEFARIYGFQIDFQRDIWKNDSFQIVYERFLDSNNKMLETGNILYANLILQGKEHGLYIFKTKEGFEHFDKSGKSVKKSLMKTPINGARLSSSFGMRKHPILGFNKMHRGTDFAAPEGTPIMASGDGKIIRARWCGGGGNCIKIKHNSTYETVYAHMKSFARGIKVGKKVRQGQIIGYVGSTGMSTGPHLHYEVIVNGKKVNSQKLKLPSGKVLKDSERKLFEVHRIKTDVIMAETLAKKN